MGGCVTGGAGFIGSHLIEALLTEGHEVVVVDNLVTGHLRNLDSVTSRITFHEGNVGDLDLMTEALQNVEVIFHLAALASVPRSIERPLDTHRETLTASVNLLEAARTTGVRRIVYAASSSAYGDQPGESKVETMLPRPMSPYAAAKTAMEFFFSAWARAYGLETVGLRYFNVFGPRQDPEGAYAAVIPRFITKLMAGESPVITGDGNQSRDFTPVANVIHGNLLAMSATDLPSGVVMNLACGHRITLPELVDSLNQVMGTSLEPVYTDPRSGDIRHSLADISRARTLLGYEPVVDFNEGLRRTVEFARQHWT